MTRRPEFSRKTKLGAWTRAGGPDDPRCECYLVARRPDNTYEDCGRQPITKSDPAEYHHLDEAESGDTPERRAYLRSIENCACVRHSCHLVINGEVSTPKITKSRHQREAEANIKASPRPARQANLKQMPPTKAYPRGRVVDRRTGEVVWPQSKFVKRPGKRAERRDQ